MKTARQLETDSRYFNEFEEARELQESVRNGDLKSKEIKHQLDEILQRHIQMLVELDRLGEENTALAAHGNTELKRYIRALEKKLDRYGIAPPDVPVDKGTRLVKDSTERFVNVERLLQLLNSVNHSLLSTYSVLVITKSGTPKDVTDLHTCLKIEYASYRDANASFLRNKSNLCGIITDYTADDSLIEAFHISTIKARSELVPVFFDTSIPADRKSIAENYPNINANIGGKEDHLPFVHKYGNKS